MNILLVATDTIRHPEGGFNSLRGMYPSLGLNYLRTMLPDESVQVTVLDAVSTFALNGCEGSINIENEAARRLQKDEFQILGISIQTTFRAKAFDLVRRAREINPDIVLPQGVYAVRFILGRKEYKGITYIGFKPTFTQQAPKKKRTITVETHLFHFNKNIRKRRVRLIFIKKIREEITFHTLSRLTARLH